MKESAGLLMYRWRSGGLQVFVVHPGGPLWSSRDDGVWSIPKGEFGSGEDPRAAALREFEEETGQPPGAGVPRSLGTVRQKAGKIVHGWALEGDLDPRQVNSNTFEMEWPPRSGRMAEFPEIDRGEWFDLDTAAAKLNPAQAAFLPRLEELATAGGDGSHHP